MNHAPTKTDYVLAAAMLFMLTFGLGFLYWLMGEGM